MSTTVEEGTETEADTSTDTGSAHKGDWLERILARENLELAWVAVKENDGAAGVDRLTIAATAAHLKTHWSGIREKLISGNYQPAAVRSVEIPKAGGGSRRLGIPTVQDRLIQQAINQILSAEFDPGMSEHSYGFRPKRSAHDAVDAARGWVAAGKSWVVDIDLKNFFDQINHDRLMTLVGSKLRDKRVLALIGRYLRAPMRHADGKQERRSKGSPQGGPLSPLLANIYLDPLDRELERRGIAFVRYADDIALFLGSERAAKRALEGVCAWLHKVLELEVNEAKSGVGPSSGGQLLGFRIHEMGNVSIAPKAVLRLKERVRQLWDARQSLTSEQTSSAVAALHQRMVELLRVRRLAERREETIGLDTSAHAQMFLAALAQSRGALQGVEAFGDQGSCVGGGRVSSRSMADGQARGDQSGAQQRSAQASWPDHTVGACGWVA